MSEYIKREDAIKALCESLPHTCHIEDCGFGCREAAAILAVPAAIWLPDLPPALEDLYRRALDPEWQKAHQQMGFISPLAEAYEALGAYEEGPGKPDPPEEE